MGCAVDLAQMKVQPGFGGVGGDEHRLVTSVVVALDDQLVDPADLAVLGPPESAAGDHRHSGEPLGVRDQFPGDPNNARAAVA
jgi:hypothetical protein